MPWIVLYVASPFLRAVMWRTSAATAMFGLPEPIFVPGYWTPPSLFELAQRTGFDIESLGFSFAIGGIGASLYNAFGATHLEPVLVEQRHGTLHRFHTIALLSAPVAFLLVALLPWNVIYSVILSLGPSAAWHP